jgi:hypothetical protein
MERAQGRTARGERIERSAVQESGGVQDDVAGADGVTLGEFPRDARNLPIRRGDHNAVGGPDRFGPLVPASDDGQPMRGTSVSGKQRDMGAAARPRETEAGTNPAPTNDRDSHRIIGCQPWTVAA